mmetsp:Transcript_35499/g.68947  ORF Transcript_35499/g.68947 Transcript_35499/m.68947 type:complete len:159 (-) Transcript_35499:244-720(-)
MAKGKVRKHTAKEIQAKIDAHKSKGGGKKGISSRKPKCKLMCKICMSQSPSLTTLRVHYQNKHPRMPFNPVSYGFPADPDPNEKKTCKPVPAPKPQEKKYPSNDKIKAGLTKLYTEKDPSKLGNIDAIVAKYNGKWAKLEAGLSKKFGETVDLVALCK